MTLITTTEGIEAFRLLAIKGRLKIELRGMKFKGGSTFAYVKKEFNLKGNRQSVYDQYVELLKEKGILKDD